MLDILFPSVFYSDFSIFRNSEEGVENDKLLPADNLHSPEKEEVACPMCRRMFPLTTLETHAIHCEGLEDDEDTEDFDSPMTITSNKGGPRYELYMLFG